MAKKSDVTVVETVSTPDEGLVLRFNDHSVRVADLPTNSIEYLLQYGFAQSLQDMSIAQIKAQKINKGEDFTQASLEQELITRRNAKVENLVSGQIFARKAGVPKGTSFDKMVAEVIKDRIKAMAAAKNKVMPKGDAYSVLAEKYLARYEEDVKAEAQRRIDNSTAMDFDLDDLLA